MSERYAQSEALLARAEQVIPLGSQTFSKSRIAYPHGVSPFFIERGQGCQVWDVDGNQYLDFVSSLLCVTLGYADADVNSAVSRQLADGVIFSLPHRLETEVAEQMVELIPCAEQVRFGKNGSDATAAAIRLARAVTGREHVAVCGYHGWQDWYIGSTTRDLGVPAAVKALTHTFSYNNLASLEALFSQYPLAAVILEPMNLSWPEPGFLEGIRALCDRHGAVLIFDEIITGFRFAIGGAQQLFGVTPDLACFGKGMANGFPISAVVGKRDIMSWMEKIFFSGTFGGDAIALTAAKATISKMQQQDVLGHIERMGQRLLAGLQQLQQQLGNPAWLTSCGHPSWSFLQIKDAAPYSLWQLKSLLLQEMASRGLLLGGGHNLNYCHGEAEIDRLLGAYGEVLPLLADTISRQNFDQRFHGQVLEPLFRVR